MEDYFFIIRYLFSQGTLGLLLALSNFPDSDYDSFMFCNFHLFLFFPPPLHNIRKAG